MARPYDVITFDCYGTLIDWQGGIGDAFASAAAADSVTLNRVDILKAYAEIEPIVEAASYRPYREVLEETARQVATRLGWRLNPAGASFLPESLPTWRPFPDTNSALQRLAAAGHRLGILSNVDDDLLAATRRHFPVDFELIVTAQQVGSYKPAHGHFELARLRLGEARWLHAAQSYFHDIKPAQAFGVPVAWINRHAEAVSDGGAPERQFRDLGELADWLC